MHAGVQQVDEHLRAPFTVDASPAAHRPLVTQLELAKSMSERPIYSRASLAQSNAKSSRGRATRSAQATSEPIAKPGRARRLLPAQAGARPAGDPPVAQDEFERCRVEFRLLMPKREPTNASEGQEMTTMRRQRLLHLPVTAEESRGVSPLVQTGSDR